MQQVGRVRFCRGRDSFLPNTMWLLQVTLQYEILFQTVFSRALAIRF